MPFQIQPLTHVSPSVAMTSLTLSLHYIVTKRLYMQLLTCMLSCWLPVGGGRSIVTEGDGGETNEPGKGGKNAHMGHSLQHLALPQRHIDPRFNCSAVKAFWTSPDLYMTSHTFTFTETHSGHSGCSLRHFLRCKCRCYVFCGSKATLKLLFIARSFAPMTGQHQNS